jgi:hypothetical protein
LKNTANGSSKGAMRCSKKRERISVRVARKQFCALRAAIVIALRAAF